jgi:hypothetical protein
MTLNLNQALFTPTSTSQSRTLGHIIGGHRGWNILDFGADPTGVADSVTAIEAAMQASASVCWGKIFIPVGNYKLSRAINLDLNNGRFGGGTSTEYTGFYFEGEGTVPTNFFGTGSGSNLIAATNAYCFESLLSTSGTGNEGNFMCFQGIGCQGYGGIHVYDGTVIVRDCFFQCNRGIVNGRAFMSWFENLVFRQFGGPGGNNRDTAQVGLFAAGVGTLRNIDARQLNQGTAFALGGGPWSLDSVHAEVSRVGFLLGYGPVAADNRDNFTGTVRNLVTESNLVNVFLNSASLCEMGAWNLGGFQSGSTQTLCHIYVTGAWDFASFGQSSMSGAASQAALITSNTTFPDGGLFAPTMQNLEINNLYQLTGGPYSSGTFGPIHISRNLSTQFPQWLVPGIAVQSTNAGGGVTGTIPAGATVASIVANDSITLNAGHSLTATLNPGAGDSVIFPGSGNLSGAYNPTGGALDTSYTLTASLAPV